MPEIEMPLTPSLTNKLKTRIAFRGWLIGVFVGAALAWHFKPAPAEPEPWLEVKDSTYDYVYCVSGKDINAGDYNKGWWVRNGEHCR